MRSPALQIVVDVLRQTQPDMLGAPVDQQRLMWEGIGALYPVTEGVAVSTVDAGGVPGEWVVAPGADETRVVLHFHGGGYVIGSPTSHRELAARLSAATGAAVLVPDYRLAPEHPFPAAVDDALVVYRWLLGRATDPGALALSGDSAGGGLVLSTMVGARDAGDPLPAAAVCWSPWVDLDVPPEPDVHGEPSPASSGGSASSDGD
ncbi:MAG: alpha/beta hydrolase fold domain-containing protein, partial [Acidimicrobiales bacterium]